MLEVSFFRGRSIRCCEAAGVLYSEAHGFMGCLDGWPDGLSHLSLAINFTCT